MPEIRKEREKKFKKILTRAGIARDARLVPPSTNFGGLRVTRTWRFAELGVRASYFGGCADWFSLVGGTIPFSRR
jgi:hypothetical protein